MFEYVLMKYNINTTHELPDEYNFSNHLASKEKLFEVFTECFDSGDAEFYHNLDTIERETYFNEQLGFPEVLTHPASLQVLQNNTLVGFALVMNYLKDNIHISCMCVLPEFQSRGIGRLMLEHIESWGLLHNLKSITLGTETKMKAFQLYNNYGFKITETHKID